MPVNYKDLTKMEIIDLLITVLCIIFAVIVIIFMFSGDITDSFSGSIHLLHEYGELQFDGQYLYYVSNDDLYANEELAALEKLSNEYIIKLEK